MAQKCTVWQELESLKVGLRKHLFLLHKREEMNDIVFIQIL